MEALPILSTNSNLALLINNIRAKQLSLADWQTEKLNFVPLRGSWFANSEADFDLEEQINGFVSSQNNKKVMLLMGDSGAGKSLYTQGLVNKLWQSFSAQSSIPIWISLPSLKDPINKVIEETLEKYGFNKDQIEELHKTRSFLFILDAYDEIRCEKNLYQTNNLDKWNAKIIITCRREYLYYKDNYKLFFAPFIGDKIQYSQYEEIYIKLFNVNQIQSYVQQYIKAQATQWNNPERYVKAMEEIAGLKELIKTPFMLKLTMEVLPQIVEKYATQNIHERKKLTQAALYDVFIEQWFIRQEQKIKEAKQIKENEDIKPEFWAYAKELATEMHKANLAQLVYNPNEESDLFGIEIKENPWDKFFTPKNRKIELLRTACLVREINQHHYAFIHLSLLEYFLTRNLYENITTQHKELTANQKQTVSEAYHLPTKQTIPAAASSSTVTDNYNNQISQTSKADYFNERLIVKEENTLQFLADRVNEQEEFKQSLFDRVYSSRNNPGKKVAAANAITILNKARVVFSGKDLSQVQIPEADLSQGIFHGTNFTKSDLRNVIFIQAYLCDADMSGCELEGVELGQRPFFKGKEMVNAISYAKDGRMMAIGSRLDIILWDPEHGQECGRLKGHTNNVNSVIFSPDGKVLASASNDKTLRLWDVASQSPIGLPLVRTNIVLSVTFSPDGKVLASGSNDNMVRLWDVASQSPIGLPLTGHTDRVESVTFSPDGKVLASGSRDNTVRLWDVASHSLKGEPLTGHTNFVMSVTFSPDSKMLASGSSDRTVRLWDVASQSSKGLPLTGHTDGVLSVTFSPDGKVLASGSSDRTVRLWDVVSQSSKGLPLTGHTQIVLSVTFSPDGKVLASGSWDETVRLWEVASQTPKGLPLFGHTDDVFSVTFSPDGKLLASGSTDNTVRLWDVASQTLKGKLLDGHRGSVYSVTFSPDGKVLASGSWDETVRLWEVASQSPKGEPLTGHTVSVWSVTFSPDGKVLASGSYDDTVRLWDVASQKPIGLPLTGHTDGVLSVTFSPDGKVLASGGYDNTVRLWDVASQKPIGLPLTGHTSGVKSVTFSPDGKVLVSGSSDKTVRLWDVASQKPKGLPLFGHTDDVTSISFSPDGEVFASGSKDNTVRLWEVSTQQCLWLVSPGVNAIHSIIFNTDGRLLAFSCGNDIGFLQHMPTAASPYCYCLVWYTGITSLQAKQLNLHETHGLPTNYHRLLNQLGAKIQANRPQQGALSSNSISNSPLLFNPEEKPEPKKLIEPPFPARESRITTSPYSSANPHKLFQSEKASTPAKQANPKNIHLKEEAQQHEQKQEEKCLVM